MSELAILFDTSHCTACKACQVSCKTWNNQPSPIGVTAQTIVNEIRANGGVRPFDTFNYEMDTHAPVEFSGSHQNPADINGHTRLIMTFNETTPAEGVLQTKPIAWAFGRRACQHCTDAPCVSICPAGALQVDAETGFVVGDNTKCIGCQYCRTACPFDVPRYDELELKINKCTGCNDRVSHGMAPACVTTCQPEALKFGDRDEMIALAHERAEFLQGLGYANACVYGENEMGGLHVIQVLKHGAAAHGAVENPSKGAMTTITEVMKPITGGITALAVAGFAVMFGLASGYKRDTLTYNVETKDTIAMETGEVVKQGDGQSELTVKEHLAHVPIVGSMLNKNDEKKED